MKLRSKVFLALLVSSILLSSVPAAAQLPDPNCFGFRSVLWINFVDVGPLPGETCYNPRPDGGPSDTVHCKRPKGTCPPPPEDKCDDCNQAGRPINLATGNTFIEQTDLRVPGLGGGLSLSRTWNSIMPPSVSWVNEFGVSSGTATGMFGSNWRASYEERVFLHADSYMKYVRGDGSVWSFGSQQCAAPANSGATIANDATNTWTITFKNGEKRVFSYASGSLISIIDRNGNTTQLTYDGSNRLTTVTDAASRHLYFNYPNASSRLVTSVTSDVGMSLAYMYDTSDRLTQVTQIDGTTLNFHYDGTLITAVKDADAKVLEAHTYDLERRGLTSTRANGVEHVTITYPTCSTSCPSRSSQ
jgi:YD repeat-containing protein